MIKYIFTSQKLSIQVHPSDEQARVLGLPSGKEECWYILDADPAATLGIGTKSPLSSDELCAASLSGEIEQLMDWKSVSAGDFFYIPAGTVHAIGAGVSLIEIQQNADITYRLYDYGRPRELHLDAGVAVSQARPYQDSLHRNFGTEELGKIVSGPKFNLHLCGSDIFTIGGAGPHYIIPLQGAVTFDNETIGPGECLILEDPLELITEPNSKMFVARAC
ncbi:MAG: class I mannose-6-phosphate isomerase [Parasphingorhabdus sp.]|uniref:class I mannose-6-phosphate isomerase n=1 Tax=Parasphingorhabdus sp. TaxID=2709688 RepID=UPI00300143C5